MTDGLSFQPYIAMVWSSPMQIAGAVFFLWIQLGPSVLAGLLVMILLIPINGAIAAKSRTYQIAQMNLKDHRVKMMNEILQGMKILKLFAWEESFEKVISGIRSDEINILTKMGYLSAGSSFIWSSAPFIVSLVSFACYVLVDENNVLDAEKAFVSLSLFNILRFPLCKHRSKQGGSGADHI
jgi:ABC-type multidrug transport system fused ATPase/permease subunit